MMRHRLMLASILLSYIAQSRLQQTYSQQLGAFQFWFYACLSFFLSCFAGVCSGLTVGYMAINKSQMELWASSGSDEEKKIAKPILQILNNHHQLLSTLLLGNALCLEALPIFLDKLVPEYLAIIISTTAVVIFGQVIPQAYCTGHHKVKIGYYASGFIRVLQFILFVFVKPIVYVLDNWIGHSEQKLTLNKQNIKTILYLHNSRQYGYRSEEIEILQNTIDLRTKFVKNHMIRLENTFLLNEEDMVDQEFVENLGELNFSKIPIYRNDKQNVIGYFKVKNLIVFNIQQKKKLKEENIINPIVKIFQNLTLLQAIEILRANKTSFSAVIHHQNNKFLGIITLKQIFENIVLKEFNDNDVRINLEFGKRNKGVMDELIEGKQQD